LISLLLREQFLIIYISSWLSQPTKDVINGILKFYKILLLLKYFLHTCMVVAATGVSKKTFGCVLLGDTNNTHDDVHSAVIMTRVITRLHFVHLMMWNSATVSVNKLVDDPQTKPTDVGCESVLGYYHLHHHLHLELLSRKADSRFTTR